MGRIGLGELLILAFLVAGFVGLVFSLGWGCAMVPGRAPFNCIRRSLGRGPHPAARAPLVGWPNVVSVRL